MKNDYEIRGVVTAIFVKYKAEILEALIDTDDFEKVSSYKATWYGYKDPKRKEIYVAMDVDRYSDRKHFKLHRVIMDAPKGKVVDHMNHNGLDNRKNNLRVCTIAENRQNQKGSRKDNHTSGIRGVHWDKKRGKWRAGLRVNGQRIDLGYFDDKEDAGRTAKQARTIHMPFSIY
ncbi:HNH endonuclease [Bacillus tropicus]|uniref:HNH endonuclease n=1 Tax=Bacillus tropicus TaxID=2026188 RepID=A0A7T2QGV0_9BACI|nr:AP2 domain-containing protein [Bacillus tropicus]AJG91747.1 AP2 domain protein [Bacillus cereus]QPR78433.1 HNH endonuclease [Bacillus tropicus]